MKTTTNATSISSLPILCFIVLHAVVVLALAPQPAWADEQVPFKGSAQGAITSITPDPGGVLLTVFTQGNATHLGAFSRDEEALLNPTIGAFAGEIVFSAGNGDQLFGSVAGGFISPTTAIGTYVFTGGTGRFVNATGNANFVAFTPDGIHLTIQFEGILSSVGANKQ